MALSVPHGAGRQVALDRLALKPYWGKPAVRNFREGDGNVGIIRSPISAIALPDNRFGRPLGAAGLRFKLHQYVRAAAQRVTSLASKHVSPHTFRHTTAVHLVSAGVDVTVIRSWLGHAHLDTTNHYARASLDTKRQALELVDPSLRPGKPPRWKRDSDLLAWLDAL